MTQELVLTTLTPTDLALLKRSVKVLETPNFAARLADIAGHPVNHVLAMLPKSANRRLTRLVRSVVLRALNVAIDTLDAEPPPAPQTMVSSMMVGITGGISGFFGTATLAIELPLTTTLMLRSIAEVARHNGEDLATIDARLACVEVFALGAKPTSEERVNVGYYATRALLNKYTRDVAAHVAERGLAAASAPLVNGLVTEIVSRFGIVVSDKIAATAVPVIGLIGGATVNVVFMEHFQKIAQSHFSLRRLERIYGQDVIRQHYKELRSAAVIVR